MNKFSPSLMCMDLLNVEKQLLFLNEKADFYHVDIMDGHYVNNITLSPDFVRAIKKITEVPIDCHLMAEKPEIFIPMLLEAGADYISPHAETINNKAFRIIDQIRSEGAKVGIVINPATPLSYISEYIHLVDKITIMSVDPGFAGQRFIPESLNKVKEAVKLRNDKGYKYLIEIDGSCNKNHFKVMKEAGVEVFIVGNSGLFSLDEDISLAWEKMVNIFESETHGLQ